MTLKTKQTLGWALLVVVCAAAVANGDTFVLAALPIGWAAALWIPRMRFARSLPREEARWAAGSPASDIVLPTNWTGSGELGYRWGLFKGRICFALGYRDSAWSAFLQADLARLPWWKRLLAARLFKEIPKAPGPRRLAWGDRMLAWAPQSARLHHVQGLLHLRVGDEERAWELFAKALPLGAEDPLLLEDLMRAGFNLGHPEVAEPALRLLMTRHGDPRLPWDRSAGAYHLLKAGRGRECLALAMQLPDALRDQPMHWLAEAVPLRLLGQLEGAAQVLDRAVAALPDAFPLWMERYKVALERDRDREALESLDQARAAVPRNEEGQALLQEWALRRAEAAFWIEDDPESAWGWMASLPAGFEGDHHPPLRLQLLTALGRYEEAHETVKKLLEQRPGDAELLLVQADCLAGLEAWKALLPFLDGLGDACRQSPSFWHLRGLALAHLDDPMGARVDLERAARMDPNRVRHLLDAGHACAELGEWERAESHWRQALHVDPRCEEALIQLSDARRELQDLEGSRRYLRECLIYYPDSADAQDRLAELEAN